MGFFQFLPDEFQSELVGVVSKQIGDIETGRDGISSMAEGLFGVEWNGADADAFYENEVIGRFIPEVAALVQAIGGFMGGLNFGVDLFDSVDSEVMRTASDLADEFDSIF